MKKTQPEFKLPKYEPKKGAKLPILAGLGTFLFILGGMLFCASCPLLFIPIIGWIVLCITVPIGLILAAIGIIFIAKLFVKFGLMIPVTYKKQENEKIELPEANNIGRSQDDFSPQWIPNF